MTFLTEKPIGFVYNFSSEYNHVAIELQKNGQEISFIDPSNIFLDAGNPELNYSLLYNDLSNPQGFTLHRYPLESMITFNKHLEANNYRFTQARIINGSPAIDLFAYRARQISLFSSLEISYPKTILVNNIDRLINLLPSLKFPLLLKQNDAFHNNVVSRFESVAEIVEVVLDQQPGQINRLLLVQEHIEPKNGHIIRVDTLNGRFLGARKIFTIKETSHAWPIETNSEPFEPAEDIVQTVEEIVRSGRIDIGSVEYFTDRKTNNVYFYNIRPYAFSNNIPDSAGELKKVAEYFQKRLSKVREFELSL